MTKLTDKVVICSAGMRADIIFLHKKLQQEIKTYKHKFGKVPSISAIAQLLMNTLYSRRFFPYYAFNLLCGLDEEGVGAIYSYDAIGSHDRVNCQAMGSGSQMVLPVLDCQVKDHNELNPILPDKKDDIIESLRDVMHGVCERDIYTGDNLEVCVITKEGIEITKEPLRRD